MGSGGLVVYYNVAVCPPETWNAHSLATFVFILFAAQGSILFPIVIGEAFVRFQPFSIKCKVGSTRLQWIIVVLNMLLFYCGFVVLVPTALKCSSPTFNIAICGTMLLIAIMGTLEQTMAFDMVFSWLNGMIYASRAVLAKEFPTQAEIKNIICQCEALKYSVGCFIFSTYLSLQLVAIFVFYIGTDGIYYFFL